LKLDPIWASLLSEHVDFAWRSQVSSIQSIQLIGKSGESNEACLAPQINCHMLSQLLSPDRLSNLPTQHDVHLMLALKATFYLRRINILIIIKHIRKRP
jgi:hypothetical protein